jgi:integrase
MVDVNGSSGSDGPTCETALVVRAVEPELVAAAAKLAKPSRSAATERAYASDWAAFESFCEPRGLPTLPTTEGAILVYLAHLQRKPRRHSSISRAYATIRAKHRDAGCSLPPLESVRNILSNIGRAIGVAPHGRAPFMAEKLKEVVRAYDDDANDERTSPGVRALAIRDSPMLLVGFAAALRRSEGVGLDVADVTFTDDGLAVTIRWSKTDQRGEGTTIGVPYGSTRATCPVRSLGRWLDFSGIAEGPLFRSVDRGGRVGANRLAGAAVDRAVKRAAERVGLDPAEYGAHSLRAGLATSAGKSGRSLDTIMRTGRWRSERVAMGYIRHGNLFDATASQGLL